MNFIKTHSKKIFFIFCFLQILASLLFIFSYYHVLNTGEYYKISITHYDPYDPFRGRYVQISPNLNIDKYADTYQVTKDSEGFAVFKSVESNPSGSNYVKKLTLNRYYMNEKLAPQAEEINNKQLDFEAYNEKDLYLNVAIKNGRYVTEGMYYLGQPIELYLTQ